MEANFLQRHPLVKDALSIIAFIICVIIGTLLINTYVFRSFSVLGPSMEKTLYTGDRLIVNRLPVTWSQLQNKQYIPERGQVIVFKNPNFSLGSVDEFVVKRVIAFPGERVTVKNGVVAVYNAEHPSGFNPDDANHGEPGSPTSGDVDTVVAKDTLFVMGDHRQGQFSCDSRECMGTIPYYDVVGPVSLRIFPFNAIRNF
jgi:signal peptidase I